MLKFFPPRSCFSCRFDASLSPFSSSSRKTILFLIWVHDILVGLIDYPILERLLRDNKRALSHIIPCPLIHDQVFDVDVVLLGFESMAGTTLVVNPQIPPPPPLIFSTLMDAIVHDHLAEEGRDEDMNHASNLCSKASLSVCVMWFIM
ncbi:hypothetical protein RHMOL_Rhmol02G0256700 [Rhododendron molle]|uniref:Uncharacterized protein n=1 Tax=Rhododendron molle TaxID=49168 RepID=A0ACC0PUJ3_RHOML|nr:hypothetical protein RHMOL_Rhmol02G0256700 [Rhododendron molle]